MKIKANVKLEKNELPIEYRKAFISLIKKCLSDVNDGEYYKEEYGNPKMKNFAFAVNLPKAKFEKNILLEGNEISFVLSVNSKKLGFVLFAALLEQRYKKLPLANGNTMTIIQVNQLNEQSVMGNDAILKMVSPLVVREHMREGNSDIYYSCVHPEFDTKATDIIKEQLINKGYQEGLLKNFQIEKINCKKTVVRHYDIYIECTLGYIRVQGENVILNDLLHSGIGSRHNEGFGLAELVAE